MCKSQCLAHSTIRYRRQFGHMHLLQQKKIGTQKKVTWQDSFSFLARFLMMSDGHCHSTLFGTQPWVYNAMGLIEKTETHSWQRRLREGR